jgi:hypothetical protein
MRMIVETTGDLEPMPVFVETGLDRLGIERPAICLLGVTVKLSPPAAIERALAI